MLEVINSLSLRGNLANITRLPIIVKAIPKKAVVCHSKPSKRVDIINATTGNRTVVYAARSDPIRATIIRYVLNPTTEPIIAR